MSKLCSVAFGLALLATPAWAVEHSESEAQKAVEAFADNYLRLYNVKDAKGIAALYTDDGVEVPPAQMAIGRQNIENWFESIFKAGATNLQYKIKQVHPIGDSEVYAIGTFEVTLPKPGGEGTHQVQGNFVNIYQWSNDALRYRVHSYNFMPPQP